MQNLDYEELKYIGVKKDDNILDLQTIQSLGLDANSLKDDDSYQKIKLDSSTDSLEILRHSTAHLMAQAIKSLYPEAKFFVGPTVDEGFYYDFKLDTNLGEDDLETIEKKMTELSKQKLEIIKADFSRSEIEAKFADDELKKEVLKRITDDTLSTYTQGDFTDLCRGPHLPNTKYIKNFKLTRIAGAYLGGDEDKEMITRIYGIAFNDKKELKDYVKMLEEAKKRDHRKLGTELGLFTFSQEIGAGLPLWLPNGARLRAKLERLLYKAHRMRGYEPVRGPELLKSDMWKVSGHYENYGSNMYFTTIDESEYGIKPMNCLGHIEIFKNGIHSYKDLPIKLFEYGVVHRHEKSGVLHGLFRVREFTQDDAHIYCTNDQVKEIILEVLEFVDSLMNIFGFKYEMEVSTKPKKAIGSDEFWENTTNAIKSALDENGFDYGVDEGGGAFYGPKIDIKILDSIGRKWQCGTIQVDMNLPERFNIEYVNSDNQKEQPVMIHRAILGSFERFIGILTEHCNGEFPFVVAPTQVVIIPVNSSDEQLVYAKEIKQQLLRLEVDCEISSKNESLNKRVRTAEKQRVPMIIVLGDSEVENKTVAIRDRRKRERSEASLEEFVEKIKQLNSEGEF